jgi:hypothetical protein
VELTLAPCQGRRKSRAAAQLDGNTGPDGQLLGDPNTIAGSSG